MEPKSSSFLGLNLSVLIRDWAWTTEVTVPLRLHVISGNGTPSAWQCTSVSWFIHDLISSVLLSFISGLSTRKSKILEIENGSIPSWNLIAQSSPEKTFRQPAWILWKWSVSSIIAGLLGYSSGYPCKQQRTYFHLIHPCRLRKTSFTIDQIPTKYCSFKYPINTF